ncbi:hypothetical protein QBC39DRAFT_417082 [Podospora conica]|nr:hypothetical protein QBC39DRAFT_417082 [Schizothecium conicum]
MPTVADEPAFARLPARTQPAETSAKTSTLVPPAPKPNADNRSSSEHTRPKKVSSFRDRLFPEARKPSPVKSKTSATLIQKKPHRTTTIAPIFNHRRTAPFQKESRRRARREQSSDVEPDGLIQKLKKHHRESAETLRKKAATQLEQAYSELSRKLGGTLKGDPADGEVRSIRKVAGDLVADVETKLPKYEADLNQLWAEWEVADAEVDKFHRETLLDQDAHQEDSNDDTALFQDTLERFRIAARKEIEDAQTELDRLSEVALATVKEIEKDFRKQTVPDLHIYFQSIDEP